MVAGFADNTNPASLASRLRKQRNGWFLGLIDDLRRPVRILDVGGTDTVWRTLGLADDPDVRITLLNVYEETSSHGNIDCVIGDARDMAQYDDGEFDVVYSNSVIEHVGGWEDIQAMAAEVRRVGRRFFVQTPNRRFPVEPHFVFPLFQFLPRAVQLALVRNFDLGWMGRRRDRADAEEAIDSIRLLSSREMRELFPDAEVRPERLMGLAKSYIAIRA